MTHQDASEGTVGLGSHALRFPVNSSGSGLRNRFAGPPRCRRLGRCFGLVRELGVGFFEFRPRRHDGAVKRTFEVAADLVLVGGAPHAATRWEPRDGALELLEALRQGSQRQRRFLRFELLRDEFQIVVEIALLNADREWHARSVARHAVIFVEQPINEDARRSWGMEF